MIAWAGAERLALGLTDPLDAPGGPRWPLDPDAAPGHRRRRQGLSGGSRMRARARSAVWQRGAAVKIDSVGVIGGGAWGTALAQTLRRAGRDVLLWAREPEIVDDINARHVNRTFLPGIALDPAHPRDGDLASAAACDAMLMVAPAQHVRAVCRASSRPSCARASRSCCAPRASSRRPASSWATCSPRACPQAPRAVLSGPSFAADVARGLPAALTLACRNEALGRALAERLGSRQFRLYWSSDSSAPSSAAR